MRSWEEFESTRRDRLTGADAELLTQVLEHAWIVGEEHFFPARL